MKIMRKCETCEDVESRIAKWIDHVGCSPRKFQRYDRLLEFVKMIANECLGAGSDLHNRETIQWIATSAKNLLKDIGENG